MSIIIPANSAASGGFEASNSCRFNDGSSDNLSRSTASGTDTVWTWSGWLKRSNLGTSQTFFGTGNGSSSANSLQIRFSDDDTLDYRNFVSSNYNGRMAGGRKFRDTSAWYHFVFVWDTTQSSSGNRMEAYCNGETISGFTDIQDPGLNSSAHTSGSTTFVGTDGYGGGTYFDGYMAEVRFIDGQALDPTSFGEFNEDSGVWKPIDVSSLTSGTNGFYLDFEDSSALGNDAVGSNNFTANNLAAIDQTTDTCTNNFATMNFLDNFWQGSAFSDGNTTVTTTNASQSYNTSSIMVSSGKWYVECKPVSGGSEPEIGVAIKMVGVNAGNNAQLSYNANGYAYRASNPGSVWYNGSAVSTSFSQYANGDIVGIALDLDNNKLYFSKNGTFGNSGNPTSGSTGTGAISIVAPTSTTLGAYGFAANESFNDQNKVFSWNFGSPPYAISSGNTDGNGYGNFEYAVPSGYLSLCTANLSEVDS